MIMWFLTITNYNRWFAIDIQHTQYLWRRPSERWKLGAADYASNQTCLSNDRSSMLHNFLLRNLYSSLSKHERLSGVTGGHWLMILMCASHHKRLQKGCLRHQSHELRLCCCEETNSKYKMWPPAPRDPASWFDASRRRRHVMLTCIYWISVTVPEGSNLQPVLIFSMHIDQAAIRIFDTVN